MLPLGLFKRRNFAVGNVQTFAMYGGLSITFFLLVLFLQEVAGYSALEAGFALMPSTIVMFFLSKRMGRLADRYGPRLFMGLGPLTAAVGLALMLTLGAHVNYFTDLLPALLVFSLGLACHRGAADGGGALRRRRVERRDRLGRQQRGRARRRPDRDRGRSARSSRAQFNSTLDQRLAGIRLSPAARTAVAQARGETLARVDPARAGVQVAHAVQSASVEAFHVGVGISAALVALGGLLGLVGIRNPRREVRCEDCAGGQIAGQPLDAARDRTPAGASRRRLRVAPKAHAP